MLILYDTEKRTKKKLCSEAIVNNELMERLKAKEIGRIKAK